MLNQRSPAARQSSEHTCCKRYGIVLQGMRQPTKAELKKCSLVIHVIHTLVRQAGKILLRTLWMILLSMFGGPSTDWTFVKKGISRVAACWTAWEMVAIPASHLVSRWGSSWKLDPLTKAAARLWFDAVMLTRSSWWRGISVHLRVCRNRSSLPLEPTQILTSASSALLWHGTKQCLTEKL